MVAHIHVEGHDALIHAHTHTHREPIQVPVYYEFALDVILDAESPNADDFNEETHEIIESAAEALYGLIHSRYILTTRGMQAMFEKYQNADFGMLCMLYN